MKNQIVLGAALLFLSGCAIKQTVEPAEYEKTAELCIIENPKVKEGFLAQFKTTLTEKGIKHKVVKESAVPTECEWTSTYTAQWSWDMTIYMSYAEIKVFKNGSLDGTATYDSRSGSGNMSKFIDAEPKIKELVDQLFQFKMAFFRAFHLG